MSVDIVVLTVIAPEFAEARRVLGSPKRIKDDDGTVHFVGSIKSSLSKRKYSVLVSSIGEAGNPQAAVAATLAIARYRPKVVFLLGIAGGSRAKTKIGEALFSERVVAYEQAALTGRSRTRMGEVRPDTARPARTIMQDLTAWLGDDKREERLQKLFAKHNGTLPVPKRGKKKEYQKCVADKVVARSATLASGEKVFKSGRLLLAISTCTIVSMEPPLKTQRLAYMCSYCG